MLRIVAALVMSATGTGVFLLLRRLLPMLIDSAWLLAGCVVGSFASTLLFYDRSASRVQTNLRPAAKIAFVTFAFIAAGHAASQQFERAVAIDFEPIGLFLWATMATSWWIIPGAAVSLTLFNHVTPSEKR
jgi:hypothetical protein